MLNQKKILAVIPARGGSKGLPRKNILPFAGKPLISWTIEQARKARYVDKTIVTTDDETIKQVSLEAGAEVPFIRPEHLATDHADGTDVMRHAAEWYRHNDKQSSFDIMICLQPTSPLRQANDIDRAIELFFEKNARAIISVCEAEHNPLWTNTLGPDLCMEQFASLEGQRPNRQELPQYYRLNGSIYVLEIDYLINCRSYYGDRTFAYVMPRQRSVDIDTLLDFRFAEFLFTRPGFLAKSNDESLLMHHIYKNGSTN